MKKSLRNTLFVAAMSLMSACGMNPSKSDGAAGEALNINDKYPNMPKDNPFAGRGVNASSYPSSRNANAQTPEITDYSNYSQPHKKPEISDIEKSNNDFAKQQAQQLIADKKCDEVLKEQYTETVSYLGNAKPNQSREFRNKLDAQYKEKMADIAKEESKWCR